MEKTIFISMLVVLVATLSLAVYILRVTKKKYIYPPHLNNCPDYYQKNSYGDCYDKHNVFHDIDNVCYKQNFANYTNSGTGLESGLCKKKQWANQCKVSWDGITNNSELCI